MVGRQWGGEGAGVNASKVGLAEVQQWVQDGLYGVVRSESC